MKLVLQADHKHDHWPVWLDEDKAEWRYRCWCGHMTDDNPSRVSGPFGIAHNEHMQAIKDWLGPREYDYFDVANIKEAQDGLFRTVSLRERQELGIGVWSTVVSLNDEEVGLNVEEIEYLIDRLFNVNNPIGMSARDKLKIMLEGMV